MCWHNVGQFPSIVIGAHENILLVSYTVLTLRNIMHNHSLWFLFQQGTMVTWATHSYLANCCHEYHHNDCNLHTKGGSISQDCFPSISKLKSAQTGDATLLQNSSSVIRIMTCKKLLLVSCNGKAKQHIFQQHKAHKRYLCMCIKWTSLGEHSNIMAGNMKSFIWVRPWRCNCLFTWFYYLW